MADMKTCRHNPDHKLPATPDFFFRDKTRPDGLSRYCKKCQREMNAEYRKYRKLRQGAIQKVNYMLQYVDAWDKLHTLSFSTQTRAFRWLRNAPKGIREIDGFTVKLCPVLCRTKKGN